MGRDDQLQDFQRFDFNSDDRFKTWLSTIEYTSDSPATLQKLRAKWYKKTIDVNFDMAWLSSLPPPSSQAPPQPPPSASRAYQPPPTSSSYGQAPPPPPPRQTAGPAVGTRIERWILMYHAALVILTVAHLIPVVPVLSKRSYHMFMQMAVLGQALKLFSSNPPSGLRPFSLAALQRYLTQIAPLSDFHFLFTAFALLSGPPITLAMFPLVIPALYALATRLAATHSTHPLWQRFGARIHALMMQKQRDALMTATWSELGVGGVLLLNLFGRNRNFLLVFAYANLLKMRYHMGETAAQHKAAWYSVAQKTAGIRARVPILNTLIQKISTWFLAVQ